MFTRRPLPFKFRGETPPEYSYEELAILEAAARRRRAFRPLSVDEQRQQTREAQAQSGIRVRIERPVSNYAAFVPQMAAWYRQETEGKVARRKLGRTNNQNALHVTLLDTGDSNEMLGTIDDSLTAEDIVRKLADRSPHALRRTGQIAFTGIELFGPKFKPWVALPISPAARSMHEERRVIRQIVAPNSGESDNRLHTSLGDITVDDVQKVADTFQALKRGIAPLLPEFIEYGPIRVTVEENHQ